MSSDVAISVRGLSKSYTIRHNQARHTTLSEALVHRLKHPLERAEREEFWALDDVSFDVKQGEVLGVVGLNGAGKSTLLKILSRITAPSDGEVRLYGRVGSLLEIGTGFHPELTGRENIYLNGSILGMRRSEIDRRFDAIVDFAGVEQFLDTPVKRYSSGMYVRLAFSVASHLDTDLLFVDEVLAVGDMEFQRRCIASIEQASTKGRAVIIVSHSAQVVTSLCTSALLLDRGKARFLGATADALGMMVAQTASGLEPKNRRSRSSTLPTVVAVEVCASAFGPKEPLRFELILKGMADPSPEAHLGFHIRRTSGELVAQIDSRLINYSVRPSGELRSRLTVTNLWLLPGQYWLDVFVIGSGDMEAVEPAAEFAVKYPLPYPGAASEDGYQRSLILVDFAIEDHR